MKKTLENLGRLGHTHRIDTTVLPVIANHCSRIAAQEGWATGRPAEYDVFAYQHHLPGGMTGTLKAQFAQYGMSERLPEVLEEVVRVRDEVLSSPHGKQFTGWTRPQPSLNELRAQYGGRSISDEELLLRYMVPAEDIEAVRAAGSLRTDYDFTDVHSLPQLVAHLQACSAHARFQCPDRTTASRSNVRSDRVAIMASLKWGGQRTPPSRRRCR